MKNNIITNKNKHIKRDRRREYRNSHRKGKKKKHEEKKLYKSERSKHIISVTFVVLYDKNKGFIRRQTV